MSKHVLVPLDVSDPSERAFEVALHDFVGEEDRLTLLHVAESLEEFEGMPGGESAEEFLDEHVEKARKRGYDVTRVYEGGEPSREIVGYAEENDVDHVVMGSHGRTGATRVLFGSVAENVTRRSPTPVTVVR